MISTPPSNCDTVAATPWTAPITPNARLRASPSNNTLIDASTCGINTPAPTPCKARAAISCHGVTANPHKADASVNSPIPAINSRRRPNRSPRRAPLIRHRP
ncbi:Uncharacterised protein [Bordetella pertussis]|nr:Uncharacterised protein [Bordetella pertussis]CPN96629.1 Uncharacterised protein [Bordetella pertussis]CRE11560.1 Uncharacterised protein [Bordetella pertussis]